MNKYDRKTIKNTINDANTSIKIIHNARALIKKEMINKHGKTIELLTKAHPCLEYCRAGKYKPAWDNAKAQGQQ